MSKVTVIKVDTSCAKCKRKVLQAVSGLQGVDKIEVDSEKGTMTVTGTVDPVDVIVQARKAGRRASVITIGAPPKPAEEKKPEQQQKKADENKPAADAEKKPSADAEKKAPEQPATVFVHHVPSWPACPRYQERVVYEQDPPPCSIM
ncbi:hypothetical protein SEVIR_3G026200v4 [Setaria viridis]|uniref:HMA domain-containing protein n=2 Tax=Setaria TaxID=4554 RepID=K3ZAI6_SETIT|nr:heavy metal-associated isoprenylated plant protein 2 [Setaria italica]XP_034588230.1 heavy metal-associated isoprenylated plant protein 2-like [Setaria viridis]RCV15015.1 hypothetical protein SETIT_3G025500v2 [Setaria italica]TKW24038.1 hypothetical protein SEVIR_3G026200v2 [Setaria viridis]